MRTVLGIFGLICCLAATCSAQTFPWLAGTPASTTETIGSMAPEPGFERVAVEPGGYAAWLRSLPLKEAGTIACCYNGEPVRSQHFIHRVVDIDVGERDLQQCADSVIRLRAEYLYGRNDLESIAFDFTSGDRSSFAQWSQGMRPRINGNHVRWLQQAAVDSSYTTFRDYLDNVFMYAGTHSLAREMIRVPSVTNLQAGDVYIRGGFPGHVVLVADVARNPVNGQTMVLLIQGFMPAMDIHVLTNNRNSGISPWYVVTDDTALWTHWGKFELPDLRRFPE